MKNAEKKTYRVWAKGSHYCYLDVEASNADEAMNIAGKEDGGCFISDDDPFSGDWEIVNAEVLLDKDDDEYDEEDDDDDDDEIYRVIFSDDEEREAAEELLDDEGCWYDYDNGDRMMLYRNGLNVLEDNSIDYDEV